MLSGMHVESLPRRTLLATLPADLIEGSPNARPIWFTVPGVNLLVGKGLESEACDLGSGTQWWRQPRLPVHLDYPVPPVGLPSRRGLNHPHIWECWGHLLLTSGKLEGWPPLRIHPPPSPMAPRCYLQQRQIDLYKKFVGS